MRILTDREESGSQALSKKVSFCFFQAVLPERMIDLTRRLPDMAIRREGDSSKMRKKEQTG